MKTVFSVQTHASYIAPLSIICIYALGVQLVLHHPELYIERNYEYSWQKEEVNSDSLLESRLSELGRIPVMETVFSVQTHASYIAPLSIICIYALGVQLVLHHPELYIERNYEYSWQNYVNNMARQGTWADYYNSSCCRFYEYHYQHHR